MDRSQDIFNLLTQLRKTAASEADVYRQVSGFLEQNAREAGVPYHGHFELTPLCNLNCKMCYVHLCEVQMKEEKLLPAATWINLMQQAIDAGMVKATLSGGECLTYQQFDELFLFLESKGILVNILTNGVLLNKKRIEFFKSHMPHIIQISLYGDSEEAYENVTGKRLFSTVFKNIQAAKNAGLPVRIAITPSQYIANYLKETLLLVQSLEIPYFINFGLVTPRDDTGRSQEKHDLTTDNYIELFKFQRESNNLNLERQTLVPDIMGNDEGYVYTGLKCGAGRSLFAIRWNGKMYPCSEMDNIFANPIIDGFPEAWRYINRESNRYPRFKKCENCKYSQVCSFCAAENERIGSRYCLSSIWCERTRKLVESGLQKVNTQCE